MTSALRVHALEIAERNVGAGAPRYVIAEAGANHNRDIGLARELIDVAAEAGADAVKFQVYSGAGSTPSKTPRFRYLRGSPTSRHPSCSKTLRSRASGSEIWRPTLAHRGIQFFATPFDADASTSSAKRASPALKIASFELVDLS